MSLSALKPIFRPGAGHLCLLAALGLTALGLTGIDAAAGDRALYKQLMFLPVGLLVMAVAATIHYRRLADFAFPLTILTLGLLVAVLAMPMTKGARRWIDIGPVNFQPSELAKIVFVIGMASYLRFRENYRSFGGLLIPLGMAFIPIGLILVEPDLGTALVLLPVLFAMLVAAGARLKHILLVVVLGLALMPAMYPLLQDYQKARIHDIYHRIMGDTRHAQSTGFQGQTATRLVGAGGLTGHDAAHAAQLVEHNGLPEGHNDMVFSVVCARWGLLGGSAVLFLFVTLICGGLIVAALNKDPFARLLAIGIVAIIFTQFFINVGMNIGLLPITGIPLPMMSSGGSSLLVNFAMIGVLLNIAARRPMVMARPAFEFDQAPAHAR